MLDLAGSAGRVAGVVSIQTPQCNIQCPSKGHPAEVGDEEEARDQELSSEEYGSGEHQEPEYHQLDEGQKQGVCHTKDEDPSKVEG